MSATCTSCSKVITAEVSTAFDGVCPWCLSDFVKPEAEAQAQAKAPMHVGHDDLTIRPGKPVRDLAPDTPAELASIIERCLAFDPSKRYSNMAEISADLRRYRKGMAVEAHSRGFVYRTWKLLTRRKLAAALIVGALLLSSTVVVLEFERIDLAKQHESEIWTRKGEKLLAAADDRGAREAFTRAIEIRPSVKAYLDRNFASWRLCDLRACLEDTAKALDLDPTNAAAVRTRAVVESAVTY